MIITISLVSFLWGETLIPPGFLNDYLTKICGLTISINLILSTYEQNSNTPQTLTLVYFVHRADKNYFGNILGVD